jgi:hypothetical protein
MQIRSVLVYLLNQTTFNIQIPVGLFLYPYVLSLQAADTMN